MRDGLAEPSDTIGHKEAARRYGKPRDWWYCNWRRLVERDGMPGPINSVGHPRFPRARFLLWLAGVKPQPAANDPAPAEAKTIEQHRADLAREYRRTG